MIKKLLLALVSILALSCSSEYEPPAPRLWFQLSEFEEELQNKYSFSDINYKIYNTQEEWAQETNALFSGKFDETGELTIENLPGSKEYYVDIYTDDNFLSNWGLNFSDSSSMAVFRSNEGSGLPHGFNINKSSKTALGEWRLNQVIQQGGPSPSQDRTFVDLTINKDFEVIITDSIEGVEYKAKYTIMSMRDDRLDLELKSVSPRFNELFRDEAVISIVDENESIILSFEGINIEYKRK